MTFWPAQSLVWQLFARSQNDNEESDLLVDFADRFGVDRSFVEFGFHAYSYNSVGLTKLGYKGLLLDGNEQQCDLANSIFRKLKYNSVAECHWITLESLNTITDFISENGDKLGILSIDIDGNDYWILKALLHRTKPHVICVEYNASFGLRCVTVPYKADFDRHKEHPSGWYHGASIAAFCKLLDADYALVKNIAGVNLIFVRRDILNGSVVPLGASDAYAEGVLRNRWSHTDARQQWETIKGLDYVDLQ